MDKVSICKKNKPQKVVEHNNVHYFYWRVELGVGHIKLWKFKIPTFPIKFLDYEPIKTILYKGQKVVLTRFHYRIFVYFNNLILDSGKPIVDFSFGSHSPLAHVNLDNSRITTSEPFGNVDSREIDAFVALYGLYKMILDGKLKGGLCEIKSYDITNEKIKDEFLFDPTTMNGFIALGTYPQQEELTNAGFSL